MEQIIITNDVFYFGQLIYFFKHRESLVVDTWPLDARETKRIQALSGRKYALHIYVILIKINLDH